VEAIVKIPGISLKDIEGVLRVQELSGGSSGAMAVELSLIMKQGPDIVAEVSAYQNIASILGRDMHHIFPAIKFFLRGEFGRESVLFIEPVPGETLETVILKLGELLSRRSSEDAAVILQKTLVQRMLEHVKNALGILHKPLKGAQYRLENFVQELFSALIGNLQGAGIEFPSQNVSRLDLMGSGILTPIHRDCSVVNIIGNADGVRFIDPRSCVPHGTQGGHYGSPAIDMVALWISLTRKELEIERQSSGFSLGASDDIRVLISKREDEGWFSPKLITLCEAVVWSQYAACRCAYCMAPERSWLYERMVQETQTSLARFLA